MVFNYSCWFIFSSTVFTYTYLKLSGSGNSSYNTTHRLWAAQNEQLSRNILLISLIAAACFLYPLGRQAQITVFILAIVTGFYGFIEIPFTNPKIKLRDLGMVKTVFVGIVWSVTTVMVPLAETPVDTSMMIFLLLRRFLFLLALTLAFEIKDMHGDEQHNLKTLPLAIGVANTKLLAQGILAVLVAINIVQYFFFNIPLSNMIAVNLSLLLSIICIQPLTEHTGDYWYYLVLDGMMVVQFIFVYAATKYF